MSSPDDQPIILQCRACRALVRITTGGEVARCPQCDGELEEADEARVLAWLSEWGRAGREGEG